MEELNVTVGVKVMDYLTKEFVNADSFNDTKNFL
jgi:hypothetical protein